MILYEGSIFLSAMIQRRRGDAESDNRLMPAEDPPAGALGIQGPWDES